MDVREFTLEISANQLPCKVNTRAQTHTQLIQSASINASFSEQRVESAFSISRSDASSTLPRLFSPHLWAVVSSTSLPPLPPSRCLAVLGSPGDTVLLSSLTDWHRQNESSAVPPTARLCPPGGLAGCISIKAGCIGRRWL